MKVLLKSELNLKYPYLTNTDLKGPGLISE